MSASAVPAYQFPINEREAVVATPVSWCGEDFADLRVHYLGNDGTSYPTKKGLRVRCVMLPQLEAAVQALRAIAAGGVR